jgi:inosose dehydratase
MKVGMGPITWNNEDLADLRPPVGYEQVLDEIRASGFDGTELGDGFPRDPTILRAALEARGLAMPSAWCGLNLVDAEHAGDDERHVQALARLMSAVGGECLNLAHQGTPERRAWAGRADEPGAPRLDDAGWERVAGRCEAAGRIAREHGLRAAFHPHAGTYVETGDEVEELARRTDPELVGWCFDTGHAIYGGVDPVAFVRRHGARIRHVHLKDVDGVVFARLRAERAGWEDGLRSYVFAELGHGVLDLAGVIAALRDVGYQGWLIVEQDTSRRAPIEAARVARAALRGVGL